MLVSQARLRQQPKTTLLSVRCCAETKGTGVVPCGCSSSGSEGLGWHRYTVRLAELLLLLIRLESLCWAMPALHIEHGDHRAE